MQSSKIIKQHSGEVGDFICLMLSLARESGRIALKYYNNPEPVLKPDKSVLTKADTEIEDYIQSNLEKEFPNSYKYLMEEKANKIFSNPQEISEILSADYLWCIDPLDGTRSYSNKVPNWGISIGLLKNQKPFFGMVYFPALKELFYCDRENAYFVSGLFERDEIVKKIEPIDQAITKQSMFLCNDSFWKKFRFDHNLCQPVVPCCAVMTLCWPCLGRGCGALFGAYPWDMAGSWPILQKVGLQLRSLEDGAVLERFTKDIFALEKNSWKLKEYYILSTERNYTIIKDAINKRIEKSQ